jgi:O-antigen ligase
VVAWLNFFRYGSGFLYVPYVLTEAILLFVLATQLIRTQEHLEQLLMALALVMIVRNLMDLGVTLYSFQSGDALGAIRHDRLLVAGTVTTESEWRSLFLPILALGALFARKKSLQMLLLGAVFLDVAWLAFAASRTAILGLGLAMVFLPIFAPPEMRKRVLRLAVPAAAVAAILMTVFSEAWTHIVITSQEDVFTGSLDEGRWVLWGGALEEFWKHPWIGNSVGAKHTFVLENARSMGLVFLVPYGIAVYLIWRHLSKVRRQRPPGASQGYICGLQVTILMVAVMGVTGSLLNTGTNAFFFWMLVGAAEGYYLQQRKEQQTGEAPAVQGYLSRLPFRRRRVASAGSVFS